MSDAAPLPSLARSPPLGWIFMARPPVVCPCDTSVKGTLPGFQPVLNRIVESGDLRGLCRPSAAIAGSGQRRRRRSARQRRSIWKKRRSEIKAATSCSMASSPADQIAPARALYRRASQACPGGARRWLDKSSERPKGYHDGAELPSASLAIRWRSSIRSRGETPMRSAVRHSRLSSSSSHRPSA
jgi:hypothetical protein